MTKINITDYYSYIYTSIEASSHPYLLYCYWLRSVTIYSYRKCRSRRRPSILTFEAYDEVDRGLFCLSTPLHTCSICIFLELSYGMRRPKVISGRDNGPRCPTIWMKMNYYLSVMRGLFLPTKKMVAPHPPDYQILIIWETHWSCNLK